VKITKPLSAAACALALGVLVTGQEPPAAQQPAPDAFRFKSGVDLINVTATVSDSNGRFVPGLRKEDFLVSEDDQPVEVTHFSAERVPVSLGIALDTSGSMDGEKIREAESALGRFLYELLGQQDEIFLYVFSNYPRLVQGWTTDRQLIARELDRIRPNGGTAMYDTVSQAIPLVAKGQNRKKALLIISDGRDTSSAATVLQVKSAIRESEALVYAIGIDCGPSVVRRPDDLRQLRPIPFPFPPGRRRGWPPAPPPTQPPDRGWMRTACNDPVDTEALRDMTDDSGGRTEIIRSPRDLDPSTAGIADELSKQYYLGYPSGIKRDGRWHAIHVEVRNHAYRVRARRGYVAS
jgi:Ca-activated chloride channel family protein